MRFSCLWHLVYQVPFFEISAQDILCQVVSLKNQFRGLFVCDNSFFFKYSDLSIEGPIVYEFKWGVYFNEVIYFWYSVCHFFGMASWKAPIYVRNVRDS